MKKLGLMMAVATLMGGFDQPMHMSGRRRGPNPYSPAKKLIVPDIYVDLKNVPKGHYVDSCDFTFDTYGPKIKVCVHVEFTYSSKKAIVKKLTKLEKELAIFISKTNLESLSKIAGFTVIQS